MHPSKKYSLPLCISHSKWNWRTHLAVPKHVVVGLSEGHNWLPSRIRQMLSELLAEIPDILDQDTCALTRYGKIVDDAGLTGERAYFQPIPVLLEASWRGPLLSLDMLLRGGHWSHLSLRLPVDWTWGKWLTGRSNWRAQDLMVGRGAH